ncbi:MAG: glutamate synthase subunit beta [Kiritimatiellae bacterium]|nr:glutamate synthase subunit beta [Kiritimatiellia bacterium]
MERIHNCYRPVRERVKDFAEVERRLSEKEVREQTARCMDCGIPFCHGAGCPLANHIPDENAAVARGDYKRAYELLSLESDFPEFTARVCPALCEAACCHQLDEESVMVRQSEKFIIETAFAKGWVVPRPPARENGLKAAVVGAGPAGLSAAVTLRRQGYAVTVFEQEQEIGGLLRYGIPYFKLDKQIIDRRRAILEAEGIRFFTGVKVGEDVSAEYLKRRFERLVLAIGTPAARDLKIPGRGKAGIHFALEYLGQMARGENRIDAKGKRVVVIGGGDTGSDCVGTANRQGARSVVQIELMPKPPAERSETTPWPAWPYKLRTSSSHEEGCERRWCVNSLEFTGGDAVEGVRTEKVEWEGGKFTPLPGTEETIPADLVLLAMGFTGVGAENKLVKDLGLGLTPRTSVLSRPEENVFAVGDCATGASLVVRAIAHARNAFA